MAIGELAQRWLRQPAPRATRQRGAALRGVPPAGDGEGGPRVRREGGDGRPDPPPQDKADGRRAPGGKGSAAGRADGPRRCPAARRHRSEPPPGAQPRDRSRNPDPLHQRGAAARGEAAVRTRPVTAGRGRDAARADPLREREQRRGGAALPVQARRLAAAHARPGAARAAQALRGHSRARSSFRPPGLSPLRSLCRMRTIWRRPPHLQAGIVSVRLGTVLQLTVPHAWQTSSATAAMSSGLPDPASSPSCNLRVLSLGGLQLRAISESLTCPGSPLTRRRRARNAARLNRRSSTWPDAHRRSYIDTRGLSLGPLKPHHLNKPRRV